MTQKVLVLISFWLLHFEEMVLFPAHNQRFQVSGLEEDKKPVNNDSCHRLQQSGSKNKVKNGVLNFDVYKCSLNTNVSLPKYNPHAKLSSRQQWELFWLTILGTKVLITRLRINGERLWWVVLNSWIVAVNLKCKQPKTLQIKYPCVTNLLFRVALGEIISWSNLEIFINPVHCLCMKMAPDAWIIFQIG